MSKDINHIIARVLAGEAGTDEIMSFHDWLNQDESNRQEFIQVREYWETQVEVNHMTMPEIAFERCRDRINGTPKVVRELPRRTGRFTVAATVAIFIFGAAILYLLQKDRPGTGAPVEYYTYVSSGNITSFTLPDGSNIHLNRNSRLTYSSRYGLTDRKVELEGEAYFDIIKDPVTFRVLFTGGEIEVMGTKFDVEAYPGSRNIITTLESGSVLFRSGGQQVMMAPGQQLSFSRLDSVFEIHRVEPALFTAWKDEIFKYRSITIQELCSRLEQMHHVKIIVGNNLKDVRISGSFEYHQNIDQILNIMKRSRAFTWKREGDVITLR